MRLLSLVALAWIVAPIHGSDSVRDPRQCPIAVSFTSYPVTGSSSEEIRAQLISQGPKDKLGRPRFAFADWNIKWRWNLDPTGHVLPESVQISCSAEITMPRLVPTKETHPDLIAKWYEFAGRVRQHELNHTRHAQERAWLIRERIAEAGRRHGPLTAAEANKIAGKVLNEIQALDYAYDTFTEHGKSEGAWSL